MTKIVDSQVTGTRAITESAAADSPIRRLPLFFVTYACMFVFGAILLLMGSLLPSLQLRARIFLTHQANSCKMGSWNPRLLSKQRYTSRTLEIA